MHCDKDHEDNLKKMSYKNTRDFDKPIEEIERKIAELRDISDEGSHIEEIEKLEKRAAKLTADIYSNLTPWQITLVARHPQRPYTLDYIGLIVEDFVELHGDRLFKDDPAIVGGIGKIGGRSVIIIGQQKGRNTKQRFYRNYGMPHPEGYRKALRLMHMAERFNMPIVTFIDTPGAAPDIEAEERGQSEAIARNLLEMSHLRVPILSVVIGEGGSGGALAIGVADKVMMFEYSTYSVISPEGCAAILWKDGTKSDLAAKALKINSDALIKLGVVDKKIKEPLGGAHRDPEQSAKNLKEAVVGALEELTAIDIDTLLTSRYEKFRKMGIFLEGEKVEA
jgi:acetyl-CoA carboxylase carboxyl transferase subunit alpha